MTPEEDPKARPAGQAGQRPAAAAVPPVFSWAAIESLVEETLRLPDRPESRWHRAGMGARGERTFEIVSGLVMLLFMIGWTVAIVSSYQEPDEDAAAIGARRPSVASRLTDALTQEDAPAMAYLTDVTLRALTPLRGESGRLKARFQPGGTALPVDSVPEGAAVELTARGDTVRVAGDSTEAPVSRPGIWSVVVRAGNVLKPVTDFNVITLVPMSARRNGRVGLYYIGSWPTERGRAAARGNYAPPRGFIEVTPQNQDTYVSDHFRLRDFLTHDQQGVWPKYLVLQTPLLDKLELVMTELERRGIRTKGVRVMSGFRTPQYNRGGGNTAGRAELSRHMYGDASDIYIDNDGNGVMDDLNRDGRLNPADARVILNAVEKVEREHPALVGGAGTYPSGPGHGPFIHIDTRGYRARWVGTPGGG